jgi:hypothetical protein
MPRSRRPDRDAYDRWVRTEEVPQRTEKVPQATPGRRLQAGRRHGQRALAKLVAAALRAPDHGLLYVLNLAAQYQPPSADRADPRPHLRGRRWTRTPSRVFPRRRRPPRCAGGSY